MSRIYISGAISGVENYKEIFKDAENYLEEKGYSVINPANVEHVLKDGRYEEYMQVDMFLLKMCDSIYMLKGWNKSCGANRELGYAIALGHNIIFE